MGLYLDQVRLQPRDIRKIDDPFEELHPVPATIRVVVEVDDQTFYFGEEILAMPPPRFELVAMNND